MIPNFYILPSSTPQEIWLAPLSPRSVKQFLLGPAPRGLCPPGTLVIYGRKTKRSTLQKVTSD